MPSFTLEGRCQAGFKHNTKLKIALTYKFFPAEQFEVYLREMGNVFPQWKSHAYNLNGAAYMRYNGYTLEVILVFMSETFNVEILTHEFVHVALEAQLFLKAHGLENIDQDWIAYPVAKLADKISGKVECVIY